MRTIIPRYATPAAFPLNPEAKTLRTSELLRVSGLLKPWAAQIESPTRLRKAPVRTPTRREYANNRLRSSLSSPCPVLGDSLN